MPWAFTQHQPLDTAHFIEEAKRRGVDLDLSTLRELYRCLRCIKDLGQ
jgi:hypothetical protein